MLSETIYIPLLNEGTTVWRPVAAEPLPDGTFRIVAEMPDDEEWAFKPGEVVAVTLHTISDGTTGLAVDQPTT